MQEKISAEQIHAAHELYCRLTGQALRLGYDRERQWYELLRQGFTVEDLRRVILYLQREIRQGRRNVGALKLSNLLQPDRFEEDLHIPHLRLQAPPPPTVAAVAPPPPPSQGEREEQRQRCLEYLRKLKESLR